jgi:hypothetical protein
METSTGAMEAYSHLVAVDVHPGITEALLYSGAVETRTEAVEKAV